MKSFFAIVVPTITVSEQQILDKITKTRKLVILLKRNTLHHVIKHKVTVKRSFQSNRCSSVVITPYQLLLFGS